MDSTSFSMIDEEGKEVTYDVLFTFENVNDMYVSCCLVEYSI